MDSSGWSFLYPLSLSPLNAGLTHTTKQLKRIIYGKREITM